MALKLSQTLDKSGVVATDAYFKISEISYRNDSFVISLRVYYNQQARTENKEPLEFESYTCLASDAASVDKFIKGINAESGDAVSRGYYYLKQKVDKFASAIDV